MLTHIYTVVIAAFTLLISTNAPAVPSTESYDVGATKVDTVHVPLSGGEIDALHFRVDSTSVRVDSIQVPDSTQAATPETTPEPATAASLITPASAPAPALLTEAELLAALTAAGWPTDLLPAARNVSACESSYVDPVTNTRYWRASAVGDSGRSFGIFQIQQHGFDSWGWFRYYGLIPHWAAGKWADPVFNARVALMIYNYDLDRGNAPWTQWTCKP